MFNLEAIVRKNILDLVPYSSARKEYAGDKGVFLDANENPFGKLNRYPDAGQQKLKETLSRIKNIAVENIFIGNGSDEVIDLLFRIFCRPGIDKTIIFSPTYGMYAVSAAIHDVEIIDIPLDEDFNIDEDLLNDYYEDATCKLLFICSPNNPTGNSIKEETIKTILKRFEGIVVIDEAYIDFSIQSSAATLLNQHPNLVVMQTLSKAWGLAGLRIGLALAPRPIIDLLNKVKPPYNVSSINQEKAVEVLQEMEGFTNHVTLILDERKRVNKELENITLVKKVYPSEANFLLVEVEDADKVYGALINHEVIVRNRNSILPGCLRITIGTAKENDTLIETLKLL